MFSTPQITVIMPVYNCELYVRQAIDSILNQTFTDFEFLIIDDASTDTTVEIVKSYNDPRIQLLQKPVNTGYTNSLNQGLKLAKGKYIARMDGDDISYPERFAKQIAYLETHPEVVVCGTNHKTMGNDKLIVLPQSNQAIKIRLLWGNCIPHSSAMIRKKILKDNNIQYDTTTEPAEDYHLWIHLLAFGKLYNLPEVLLEYRVYSNQVSRKRAEEQKKSDIAAKFRIMHYLHIAWNPVEREFLERQFSKTEVVSFKDIRIFKEVQKKLASANDSLGFFESLLFKQYLTDLEADVLRKCFLRQKRYSPSMYLEYLTTKYQSKVKLTTKKELKLFFKSLIFWKTQR